MNTDEHASGNREMDPAPQWLGLFKHLLARTQQPEGLPEISRGLSAAIPPDPRAPLTLILSPLRAGRGEKDRAPLGSLFGDSYGLPPKKFPLPLEKGEGQGEGSSRLPRIRPMSASASDPCV